MIKQHLRGDCSKGFGCDQRIIRGTLETIAGIISEEGVLRQAMSW